jgi:ATP-binding cassette subfamily B protein/subfamily B ATP-binding cassette protein MsbA
LTNEKTVAADRSAFYRFGRMLPYIRREWRGLSVISVLTVVTAGVSALMPWPLKLLVDYALGEQSVPAAVAAPLSAVGFEPNALVLIMAAGVASFALFALNAALNWGITWNWAVSGYRMLYDLAADLFARLQRLSLIYHGKRPVGDLLSRISTDSWSTYKLAADLLVSPAQSLLTIVAIGGVAWALDPLLAILLLATTPLLVWSARFFGQRLKRRARLQREAEARLTSFVHQTLTAIPVVKAFTREERNREDFRAIGDTVVRRAQRGNLANQAFQFVNGSAVAMGSALVLLVGGRRVLSGDLSLGSLLVFIAYAQTLRTSFASLLTTYGKLKWTEASIDRVLEVLDAEEEVPERPTARPFARWPGRQGIAVTFENVTFGYEPNRPVLSGINLHVQAGETVALVGSTGAGKTTLASLVPRFFEPREGRVLFDGTDARDIQLRSLRQQVALVLQEPFLLPLSVAENIAYGRPDATREEIIAAAVAANADEFIRLLPDGYDTGIGERGATLSGGQRQRLAIARALLKDAPILVLDEPTSALDSRTEALILEALERLMVNRTTFIIAHRLSTIRNADRIVVLKDGTIAEQGRQDDLIAAGGDYWQFHTLQFGQPLREASL